MRTMTPLGRWRPSSRMRCARSAHRVERPRARGRGGPRHQVGKKCAGERTAIDPPKGIVRELVHRLLGWWRRPRCRRYPPIQPLSFFTSVCTKWTTNDEGRD